MDYNRFQTACQKLRQIPGYESSGGKSQADIEKAEEVLGIRFSRQATDFYQTFDYVEYDGGEIFGIKDGTDSSILEGNIVAYSLYDREYYHMPVQWIPVCNFYDGSLAYFDYSTLNENDEPRVIRAYYNAKKREFTIIEVLADDFGEFLSMIIELHSKCG